VLTNLFTGDKGKLALFSWGTGALASILGLWVSYTKDLPTSPLIVYMYGVLLLVAVGIRDARGSAA
jgi:ABC-type Mn2+/Zn2+ transport system permease subunit